MVEINNEALQEVLSTGRDFATVTCVGCLALALEMSTTATLNTGWKAAVIGVGFEFTRRVIAEEI